MEKKNKTILKRYKKKYGRNKINKVIYYLRIVNPLVDEYALNCQEIQKITNIPYSVIYSLSKIFRETEDLKNTIKIREK